MRIALVLSGQPRLIEQCFPSQQKHLIDALGCDVFFHFWNDGTPGLRDQLLQTYRPLGWALQEQVDFAPGPFSFNVQSMFFSIQAANAVKAAWETRNGFRYDCVIRCRTDLAVHATPRVDLLEDGESLHCFRFGFDPSSDWCNDQFAFGSSDVMDRYAECYEHLHEGLHRGPDHGPEAALTSHVRDRLRLPVRYLDDTYDCYEQRNLISLERVAVTR
ncbi:MAG: hypothetical protein KDC95_14675 [Planctomycetes bacterium]|nr:hypothetical protein [Planctomycetota bacterium]